MVPRDIGFWPKVKLGEREGQEDRGVSKGTALARIRDERFGCALVPKTDSTLHEGTFLRNSR